MTSVEELTLYSFVKRGFTRGINITRLGLHKVYKYWLKSASLSQQQIITSHYKDGTR